MIYGSCDISELLGKTLTAVKGGDLHDEEVRFVCDDGSVYLMYHAQDCCESVTIEDVNGDWSDLIGSPITEASKRTQDEPPEPWAIEYRNELEEWTFYHLGTAKGVVVLRWYGESNGFYGTSVDFARVRT